MTNTNAVLKPKKKLSMREVGLDKATIQQLVLNDKENEIVVARFIGRAVGFDTGEGDNGPWVRFKGEFKVTNFINKTEYIGPKMHVPDPAETMIVSMLAQEGVTSAQFGFDISARYSESSATSYEYEATPLIQPASDPFEALEASLPAAPTATALPAPEKAKDSGKKSG